MLLSLKAPILKHNDMLFWLVIAAVPFLVVHTKLSTCSRSVLRAGTVLKVNVKRPKTSILTSVLGLIHLEYASRHKHTVLLNRLKCLH